MKLQPLSPQGKVSRFNVPGSVTGPDGEGISTNRFVSPSGRVVLEPDDWNVAYWVSVFQRALPADHVVHWEAVLRGTDKPRATETRAGHRARRHDRKRTGPGQTQADHRPPRRCRRSHPFLPTELNSGGHGPKALCSLLSVRWTDRWAASLGAHPRRVNRDMRLYSTLPGWIGIPTSPRGSLHVFQISDPLGFRILLPNAFPHFP